MSKTVTLRLKDDIYNAFMEAALAENRPLSNLIETGRGMDHFAPSRR